MRQLQDGDFVIITILPYVKSAINCSVAALTLTDKDRQQVNWPDRQSSRFELRVGILADAEMLLNWFANSHGFSCTEISYVENSSPEQIRQEIPASGDVYDHLLSEIFSFSRLAILSRSPVSVPCIKVFELHKKVL
ncbi:MAG: hypothetical protein WC663_02195 [Patescibacteria group bacterium]|jgi:hypothetical protein